MTCQVRCTSAVLGWDVGTGRPYCSGTNVRAVTLPADPRRPTAPRTRPEPVGDTTVRRTRNDLQLYRTPPGPCRGSGGCGSGYEGRDPTRFATDCVTEARAYPSFSPGS